MGQYLQTEGSALSQNPKVFKLVNQLRAKLTLENLCEVFNDYMQECYPKEDLTWTEFDMIFSPVLNDCDNIFQLLNTNFMINIYEVFITFVIFIKNAEFDEKLLLIFKAFDIDGGGSLDRQELSKFLMCTVLGLCKILGLKAPSRIGIQQFTFEQFKVLDEDGSGSIDFAEFEQWISKSTEIQEFLLKYTGVQTIASARLRFEKEQKEWKEFFDSISVNFCGKRYVEYPYLVSEIDKRLQHIEKPVRDKLYYLFDYDGEAIITEKQFTHIMKIWSAFSANDINNDNELDANEVKTLFWLFDGQKPTLEKIQRETEIMDEDKSGTIDRLEWLAYLCSAGSEGKSGFKKDYYDFELRDLFERADINKSGTINIKELVKFLQLDMEKELSAIEPQNRWKLDDQFSKTARDVFTLLKGRPSNGLLDDLNWADMKNYRQKCSERTGRLQDEIRNLEREEALKLREIQRQENMTQVKARKATFSVMDSSIATTAGTSMSMQSTNVSNKFQKEARPFSTLN